MLEKRYAAGFKASPSRILKFKKNRSIVNRKVTKYVSRINFVKKDFAAFTDEVKKFIDQNDVD